jgi:Brp/Blh family beta-carotene 15,15'-monooxygenase
VAPSESLTVFSDIVAIAGRSMESIEVSTAQMVAGVAASAAVVAQVVTTLARLYFKQVMVAGLELLETLVVSMALFVLHPLFAMGLYVLAWHSWRHIHSLTQFLPSAKSDGSWKQVRKAIVSIHIQSLPLLVPTVMIFGVIAWWRLEVWSSELLGALTIAFFAVVTLPHHLLVERLFRRPQQFSQQTNVVPLGAKTAAPSVALQIGTIDISCHNSK